MNYRQSDLRELSRAEEDIRRRRRERLERNAEIRRKEDEAEAITLQPGPMTRALARRKKGPLP